MKEHFVGAVVAGAVIAGGIVGGTAIERRGGDGCLNKGTEFFIDSGKVAPGVYNVAIDGKPYAGPVEVISSDEPSRIDEVVPGEKQKVTSLRIPKDGWIRGYFPNLPNDSCVELVKADGTIWENKQ